MQKISPSYAYVALFNIAISLLFLAIANVFFKPGISKFFSASVGFWLLLAGSIFLLAMGLVQIITKQTYGFNAKPRFSYEIMYFGLAGIITILFALSFVSKQGNLISSALFSTSILILIFLGYKSRYTNQKK